MKLVDLDQTIFIPVVDETHGGVTVEMQMTVGEFFARCCQGFEPEVVEAIPVEWILNKVGDEKTYTLNFRHAWGQLVGLWANEQEAR
jgi:hypothetical protein